MLSQSASGLTTTYSIGGTITGLTASGLVLQNNTADDLTVASGATTFTFATKVSGAYAVTVKTQPTGLNCTVTNGSGTATADVTNVSIACSSTSKKIYVTTTAYNGNLGGISGADTKCQSEYSGTKALIVGTSRRACTTSVCTNASENLNWVLKANTKYTRADGTEIGTTNSAGIITSFTNSIGTSGNFWHGMAPINVWTVSSYTCSDWSTSSSAPNYGKSNSTTDITNLGNFIDECIFTNKLLCAEQ